MAPHHSISTVRGFRLSFESQRFQRLSCKEAFMPKHVGKRWIAAWKTIGLVGAVWCVTAVASTTVPNPPEPIPTPAPAAPATSAAALATSPDGRCDRCGGCEQVRRMCVKARIEKEMTKVCWGYRCEQVCIPGPSVFRGTEHHRDDCGCWTCWLWKPTCAEVITRRVPVKQEVRRKVPSVRWSVEERCCHCRHESKDRPGGRVSSRSPEPLVGEVSGQPLSAADNEKPNP